MAKFKVGDGIVTYLNNLQRLSDASDDLIGRTIFAGAEVVTDRIRKAIEKVPLESSTEASRSGRLIVGLSASQKGGLLDGLGIARMRVEAGAHNVKVGFDGYNATKNKNWPKGQPNSMIARSMETGTSFRAKNPVITQATRDAKNEAERAMADTYEREVRTRFDF